MIQSTAGILKIVIFLLLGVFLRSGGVLKKSDIDGLKKIILYIAIPSVLFLSFSRLDFNLSFVPVTAAIFTINFGLFWLGVLIYKLGSSKDRILTLCMSTMNFALIGIPLYEAIFGLENLHNYTMLGVGNEIFVWFVFFFMFRWFLSSGKTEKGINKAFIKSPIIWSIIAGCVFSIAGLDLSVVENPLVNGVYQALENASKLTTPLILIFIGFNISISPDYIKKSIKITLIRFVFAFIIGYLIKFLVLDHFIEPNILSNSAFFLLISLPPVFALPILAAEYIDDEEMAVLNNSIILHALVTIIVFSVYALLKTAA